MTQTTGGMSFVDCEIRFSTNNSDWTDISGSANGITVSGGERQSGEEYTYDGDVAVVTAGKRGPVTVDVNAIYTESATESFNLAWTQYTTADGGSAWLDWSPDGGDSADWRYSTNTGVVINALPPGGEAAPGAPATISFQIKCSEVSKSAVS